MDSGRHTPIESAQMEERTSRDAERAEIASTTSRTTSVDSDVRSTEKPNDKEGFAENNDFEVWWNSDSDPENPQNWPPRKKWSNIAVMSCITFLM